MGSWRKDVLQKLLHLYYISVLNFFKPLIFKQYKWYGGESGNAHRRGLAEGAYSAMEKIGSWPFLPVNKGLYGGESDFRFVPESGRSEC